MLLRWVGVREAWGLVVVLVLVVDWVVEDLVIGLCWIALNGGLDVSELFVSCV